MTRPFLILAAVLLATSANAQTFTGQACAIDGDTIRLHGDVQAGRCSGGQPMRLWGINTREMREPGGKDAAVALTTAIRGKVLICHAVGRESYDRPVVRCNVSGADLSAMMVATGHARDCWRYSKGAYARIDRHEWVTADHVRMCGN